jgi:hypothetical protein
MRKPNYHQARKEKETSRKARQQEKQQRRTVRPDGQVDTNQAAGPEESKPPVDPTLGTTT